MIKESFENVEVELPDQQELDQFFVPEGTTATIPFKLDRENIGITPDSDLKPLHLKISGSLSTDCYNTFYEYSLTQSG